MNRIEIHNKAIDIFNSKGHTAAWSYWRMMNMDYCIYLGEMTSDEFISGYQLANRLNIDDGIHINSDTSWLMFILDGEILVMPSKPIRYHLSWKCIYNAGAVFGNNIDNHFEKQKIKQNNTININGYNYMVTLPCGANKKYTGNRTSHHTGHKVEWAKDSEWNRLLYPMHSGVHENIPSGVELENIGLWDTLSEYDLGITSPNGGYNWCQESHGTCEPAKVMRGFINISMGSRDTSHTAESFIGWRPVLRRVNS